MPITISPKACEAGSCLPLTKIRMPEAHYLEAGIMPQGVGWTLTCAKTDVPLFAVTGHAWLPNSAPILKAITRIASSEPVILEPSKKGHALAVITLSDKGSQGLREDTAGPRASRMIYDTIPLAWQQEFLIADDYELLRGLLAELALIHKYDLICTTGGTGIAPRDITPQATRKMLDLELPGFSQAMLGASLTKTPNAIISRAVCGIIGKCLVINLPGSPKAVSENLAAILPALGHALEKLQGDPSDCGASK